MAPSVLGRWDSDDVDALIAFRALRDSTGRHGFTMEDATSSDADPENPDGTVLFRTALPVVDHAEAARSAAEDAWRKNNPDDPMHGLIFPVEMVERAQVVVDPYQFEGY